MTLSQEERDTVAYNVKKAKEALASAERDASLFDDWSVASNRLYYAAYYIVSALLIQNNYTVHTHSGMKSLFHQYFVKTGIVNAELGRIYTNLFDTRQKSDYDVYYVLNETDILPLIEDAKTFINEIERLINSANHDTI